MTTKENLAHLYGELAALAPEGYAVGLHIRYATPLIYLSKYPADWVEYYNANSYYLRDPLVFWCIGTTGTARWSEIPLPDPFGVLKKAAAHNMSYGAVSSYGPITSRSMTGACRSDREFTDDELLILADITARMHAAAKPSSELTKAQIEALQCIANGDRHTAAAAKLGISESALKARLSSARTRLEARTTSEAVKKAREYRLL
ncbi:MAG: autoinducer binding domain-containing protein [Pseudorhodobacter sp.]